MSVVDEAALNCCLESGCVVLGCLPSGPRENLGLPIHLLVISWQHGRTFLTSQMEHGKLGCQALLSQACFAYKVDVRAGDLKSSASH